MYRRSDLVLYPWLRGLAFLDSLLRCGVAALFALDVYTKVSRILDPQYRFVDFYVDRWVQDGLSPALAVLVVWSGIVLGMIGTILLVIPRTAALGAIALAVTVWLDLANAWNHTWEPAFEMQFILGTSLVLVSQSVLRSAIHKERVARAILENDIPY